MFVRAPLEVNPPSSLSVLHETWRLVAGRFEESAVAISRDLEARLLEVQAVFALGGILGAMPGNQSQASEHHERGLALCRAMGVDPWWQDL